ncbi:hypothetical protein [Pararhodobacter sp. CCB-MM2]|uniref:hypothetical protein n=1 Tax=Pararhodobacter sp. CCB-MM2 TaxID=1786003 RepID=UPI00083261E1|nr:hypothetical protein [Pararhodobacter sp. CCB-MM2]
MSLTMMALRIAAVQALRSADTLVAGNVLDSQISALDLTADGELRSDQGRPFIAVYTDGAKTGELSQTGLRSNGQVTLLFNCGVSLAMAVTDKETGQARIIEELPATDPYFEAVLDMLDVQIARTLVDPENAWAQVFGDFVSSYVSKEHLRASARNDSQRLAAGQIKLVVEVFADPVRGQALAAGGPWDRFLALLREAALPELALFESFLGVPGAPSRYPAFEQLTGMTARTRDSLQLSAYGGLDGETVIAEAVSGMSP